MHFPQDWNIPNTIRLRLGANTTGRQRALVADGYLMLVLHEVPRHGQRERRGAYFFRSPDGKWSSSRESSGIPNLAEHVNDFSRAADELEAKYQSATMARDYFKVLEEAAPILRSAANMHSTLQSARDADHEDQGLIGVRDTAGDVVRSLELLCTDAKNALDYDIAKSTEEQAVLGEEAVRSGLRLNILVAIFLPLTTLSGMFGMNLTTGLEGAPAWFAWGIFALGVAIGLVVRGWVMRGVRPELVNPREVARRL